MVTLGILANSAKFIVIRSLAKDALVASGRRVIFTKLTLVCFRGKFETLVWYWCEMKIMIRKFILWLDRISFIPNSRTIIALSKFCAKLIESSKF